MLCHIIIYVDAKISLLVDEIASLRGALITKEKIIQQLISQQSEREVT